MRRKYWFVFILSVMMCLLSGMAFADGGKPRLGLSVSTFEGSPLLLQHLKLSEGEGLMIRNVAVGGDLEAAGLTQGDILLSIDGHAMLKPQDVTDYISTLPHGTRVTLDVIQKGDHRQVYSVLDNLPDDVTWKYVEQNSGYGRRGRVSQGGFPFSGGSFGFSGGGQLPGGNRTMMFSSIMQTDHGMEMVSTKVTGDPSDPSSSIEVTVGGSTYTTTVGEIEKLPDDAKNAAKQALGQSGGFSFSFGFGGNLGSMFDELLRQQGQQMDLIEQLFFNHQGGASPFSPQQPGPQIQLSPGNHNNNNNNKGGSPLRIEDASGQIGASPIRS